MTDSIDIDQEPCYLTYTNEITHEVIMDNLSLSPMYSGEMDGVGPRYCPSIEDKVNRFSDKPKHQIFVEPEGLDTKEMYIQGMSTTLPEEVQIKMYRSIKGMENCKIMRPAYAIEYDCIDPTQLKRSLEYKNIDNLFFAGQINGSSGYEEAAGQGIIAGINAVLKLEDKEPLILDRSEAYIGVLIDDLVTKGTQEPYRMMTSRAEYRLILRQDNADVRLTEKGYKVGLVREERYKRYIEKKTKVDEEINRLQNTIITPKDETNEFLESIGSVPLKTPTSIYDLLKRPEVKYDDIKSLDIERPEISELVKTQVEIEIKYEGYIKKQLKQIKQFKKMENKKLSEDIDYDNIEGLRLEARQKLSKLKPESIGQASRISGVSPADVNVLLIYLEQQRRTKSKDE
jgi:tRNA uridine 5-carboxymethylaminomethyl modification enzyme